jgi:hypothetical protein
VMIAGVEHTVLLDKEHAEALGDAATPVKAKAAEPKAAAPANKSRAGDAKAK